MNVEAKKKVFVCMSPKTNYKVENNLCDELPITVMHVSEVDSLFALISKTAFRADFVAISIEMFYQREDRLDMFDIIHTLATLIQGAKKDTKIMVLVDEDTEPRLIKQVMNFRDVSNVGMILRRPEDFQESLNHVSQLVKGNIVHHSRALELAKPKRKKLPKAEEIILTPRQKQVLQLLQEKGCSNKVIGKILKLTESTVKLHVGAILKKYRLKNRTQLALLTVEK